MRLRGTKRGRIGALLVSVGLVFAACGGDDDGPSAADVTPPNSEAMCALVSEADVAAALGEVTAAPVSDAPGESGACQWSPPADLPVLFANSTRLTDSTLKNTERFIESDSERLDVPGVAVAGFFPSDDPNQKPSAEAVIGDLWLQIFIEADTPESRTLVATLIEQWGAAATSGS